MRLFTVVFAVVLFVLSAAGPLSAQTAPGSYITGQLLVRLHPGASPARLQEVLQTLGSATAAPLDAVEGLYIVYLPEGLDVANAKRWAQQLEGVAYAEPNYVLYSQQLPGDPSFSLLWGLHNTGQDGGVADADIDAPEAWSLTTGSSDLVVAVLDTGIDYTHPDLADNMFRNLADCNANAVDDDGNGYVDDCHGIDTVNGDSNPMDDHGHGTHVSGTIGAAGNNGIGVTGVNWNVKLLPCKFLDASGSGSIANAVTCLQYVAALKDRGVNIVATNNSWGSGTFSQALLDAIDAQRSRGILFIASAGNSGLNTGAAPTYPGSYDAPNVIAVASTTSSDGLSGFSNFGARTVHLGAPGSSIYSTKPGNTYGTMSGTSMAAPHVTGVAALLKAQDPARDWRAIRNLLLAGADATSAMSGTTITGRRLNAHGALTCSNNVTFARQAPVAEATTIVVGSQVRVRALHINCAAGAGNVTVSVTPAQDPITLVDDGAADDALAGDGVYSGVFAPTAVGTYTLTFPNNSTFTIRAIASTTYIAHTETPAYRTISGTPLALGDDTAAVLSPPFPVRFGGTSFDTLYVSSNGHVNFDGLNTAHANAALPAATANTLIAPFWDDLVPGVAAGSAVSWAVTGSAPARELVIEWANVSCYPADASATITFQVVFFERSETILFNYADVLFGGTCAAADRGARATVGVQSSAGAATQFSFNGTSLANASSILWTLPGYSGPFTDSPLIPGVTPIRRAHITELRTRIDTLRERFGLTAKGWTDAALTAGVTTMKVQHLLELRQALVEAYQAAGANPPVFAQESVQARIDRITAAHISELRSATLSLESR